ncbi:MAG: tyrosine-protein phosphatase [Candidatus Omnitrophica bacterium]|nr:tyrosine-protein phosphatase [Candidatus Omnitrophota bacterium]
MRNTRAFSFFKLALIFFFCFAGFSCAVFHKNPPEDLPRFTSLNDWLYRGGQPTEQGLVGLKEKGVRTIVNFRNEPDWVEWEKSQAEALGMKYVNLPWRIWSSADPELLDQFFEVLDNPANRPVFMHCKHGRDRTGVMSTLALMRYEKLSEEEARKQTLQKIRPHLRYRFFVNRKINSFLKERASEFSESSA